MSLNISKCVTLKCSRRPPLFSSSYLIFNLPLKQVTEHPYMGVVIDAKTSFSAHIDHIIFKTTKMLKFIRCNLCKCNKEVKCMAYLSLVQPSLEYASSTWNPYLIKDIMAIEKIQRHAACWVTANYNWRNGISITSTLTDLGWPILSKRRQIF